MRIEPLERSCYRNDVSGLPFADLPFVSGEFIVRQLQPAFKSLAFRDKAVRKGENPADFLTFRRARQCLPFSEILFPARQIDYFDTRSCFASAREISTARRATYEGDRCENETASLSHVGI